MTPTDRMRSVCATCGKPATCVGAYEGATEEAPSCDDCCGHGCEDGKCRPLAGTEGDSADAPTPPSFYVASKTKHAEMWKAAREAGEPIIATWIDEAGPGQTKDPGELADRCVREAAQASATILYCEPGEALKGALIEVGAALAAGRLVVCVGTCASISETFNKHRNWRTAASISSAFIVARTRPS